jgi:hypothetical protein
MDNVDDCETVITPGSAQLGRSPLTQPPEGARCVPTLNCANGAIVALSRRRLSLTMFVRFAELRRFLRVLEMRDYSPPFWPQNQ